MTDSLSDLFELIDRQLTAASQRTREQTLSADEIATLTGTQIYYLHTISRLEPPTLTELAKRLNVTKPSAAAVVNKLIGAGYLERSQSTEDMRVFALSLTEKGQRVVQIKQKTFDRFAQQIRSQLSPAESAQLVALLSKALQASQKE
jgi:DNA-binding MarR family transcriptional regulator